MKTVLFSYLMIVCLAISCKKDEAKCNNNSPWYQDGIRMAYKNDKQLIGVDSIRVFIKKIGTNRVR